MRDSVGGRSVEHTQLAALSANPHLLRTLETMIVSQQEFDMTQRVALALEDCGHPQLRRVHVRARKGHVTLEGTVPSYYGKQLAQAVSLGVAGVTTLDNRLAVIGDGNAADRNGPSQFPRVLS